MRDFCPDLGFKTLKGALIETDQTVAWSIQIGDQGDHDSNCYGNKNQAQPEARCHRCPASKARD